MQLKSTETNCKRIHLKNGCRKLIFNQEKEECRLSRNADYGNNITTNNINISTTNILILPYKRKKGQKIIKSVNN